MTGQDSLEHGSRSTVCAVPIQTETGCMDCERCTGHVFTGLGRAAARGGLAVGTLGVSALLTRRCRRCGHPMSEHGRAANGSWPAGWYPDGTGGQRWWTGTEWSERTRPVESIAAPPDELPAVMASAGDDAVRLEKLADLHRDGALTDAEFAAAKARILGL